MTLRRALRQKYLQQGMRIVNPMSSLGNKFTLQPHSSDFNEKNNSIFHISLKQIRQIQLHKTLNVILPNQHKIHMQQES